MKDGFDGEMDVGNFGDGHAHGGEEDALDGFAHPCVLHGRSADDGGGVDGVLAMGDAGEMEDGVLVGEGVEAGVVAEGALGAEFAQLDVALEDDFGVGGDLKIDGFALNDFDGGAAQEAGDEVLLDFGRGGDDGGKGGGGIGADGYGDFEARAAEIAEGDLGEDADGTVGDGTGSAGGFGQGGDPWRERVGAGCCG